MLMFLNHFNFIIRCSLINANTTPTNNANETDSSALTPAATQVPQRSRSGC